MIMKVLKKINPIVYFIVIIHFVITLFFDASIFHDPFYCFKLKYLAYKFVIFIVLFVFWNFVFETVIKVKQKDERSIRRVKFFLIYFGVMLVFLFFAWPGIWVWDEFWIYKSATDLQLEYWHNYLTSIYYILGLMLLPFGAGIIIVQILIISLIVSYIVTGLSYRTKYYYFIFLIFLLPPIIVHNLNPMRATLYSFLILYILYFIYYDLKNLSKIKISTILPLIICIPIVVNWRSEGIVLLPFVIVLLYFSLKGKISTLKFISLIAILILFVQVVKYPQKKWTVDNKDYVLTAMLNPLSNMLHAKHLNKFDELEKDLSLLINLEVLKNHSNYRTTPLFWENRDTLFNTYNQKAFDVFTSAYIKLVIYNPGEFIKVRAKTFQYAGGFSREYFNSPYAIPINDNPEDIVKFFRRSNGLNKSIYPDKRQSFTNVLEGRNVENADLPSGTYLLFWNFLSVFTALLVLSVLAIYRKDLHMITICLSLWASAFCVFVTAPATYFMYYLPVYLITFVLLFCYVIDIRSDGWKLNKRASA